MLPFLNIYLTITMTMVSNNRLIYIRKLCGSFGIGQDVNKIIPLSETHKDNEVCSYLKY